MPDNPNDRGDKAPLTPARDGSNKFVDEARVLAYRSPGVCVTCHSRDKSSPDIKSLDFFKPDFGRFQRQPVDQTTEALLKQLNALPPVKPADANAGGGGLDARPAKPGEVRADAVVEVKFKSDVERFREADPITKTSTVISRLPDFKIAFADKKLSMETDFTKLLEATPGVDLGGEVKGIVGAAKRISLDGDKFTMDLKDVAKLKIDRDIVMVGKITDLRVGNADKQFKFEVQFDPKNTERVSIKNISGMTLERQGADPLAIHEISLDTSGEKPMLKVTVDNPARWARELSKTVTVPLDLSAAVPGLNADFLKGLVKTLSDSKTALQSRDAGMLLSGLPDEGIRNKLVDVLKGLTSIEKKGNELTIVRDNGVSEHDFGGPRLRVSPVIRCQIDTAAGGIDVRNIDGVKLVTALPSLPSRLGLGSELAVGITGVSLSPKYGPKDNPARALTVRADSIVDSVRIKLNAGDLNPAVDGNGHWRLDINMTNPLAADSHTKLLLPLKFDQTGSLSNSSREIAGMAADALQGGAASNFLKAADTVDGAVTKVGNGAIRLLDEADTQLLKLGGMALDTARIGKQVMGNEVRDIYRFLTK
ncbi:MAG: hypothetical protein EKK48_24720 [Candidatus Melainabacteria bacterium]|nr:MAG: hypothetical protein EKK48_24720 [Candidatus Melainabacteria bacterium]